MRVGGAATASRRAVLRWAFGLLAGAVIVWVVVAAVGGLAGAGDALARMDPWFLVPAVIVEAASYVVLGQKLRDLVGPERIGLGEGVELGLVVSGFGLLTPARPAEGLAAAGRHLRANGVPGREIGFVIGFAEWSSVWVFLLLSALNALVVVAVEREGFARSWPLALAAALVLVLLAGSARLAARPGTAARLAVLVGKLVPAGRGRTAVERREAGLAFYEEARVYLGSRRRRIRLGVLTAGAFLGDVACLWFALLAGGGHVGFDVALLAVSTASLASVVPLVPGGIGIAEATIPAVVHHFGMSYADGLAAALVYRVLGTLIPAALGTGALLHLRRRVTHRNG